MHILAKILNQLKMAGLSEEEDEEAALSMLIFYL